MAICSCCNKELARTAFSNAQLKKKASKRCTQCVDTETADLAAAAASSSLPPLVDEWNLTTLKIDQEVLEKVRADCKGKPVEEADLIIYTAFNTAAHAAQSQAEGEEAEANFNIDKYEALQFPVLFAKGTGFYSDTSIALKKPMPFEEYVMILLKQVSGFFLTNIQWLTYAVQVTAFIRRVRETTEEKLNTAKEPLEKDEFDGMTALMKAQPIQSFCFRYLVGDDKKAFPLFHYYSIVMMQLLMNPQQKK